MYLGCQFLVYYSFHAVALVLIHLLSLCGLVLYCWIDFVFVLLLWSHLFQLKCLCCCFWYWLILLRKVCMGEHKHNNFHILLGPAVRLALEPSQILSIAYHVLFWNIRCHQICILCLHLFLYCCLVHIGFSLNFHMQQMPLWLYVKQLDCHRGFC